MIAKFSPDANVKFTSKTDIIECLATIKSLHPSWNDADPNLTINLWHYNLKDFTTEEVKRAVLNVASKSKFIPKLADVLEEIDNQQKTQAQMLSIGFANQDKEFLKCANEWFYSLNEKEKFEMNERIEIYNSTGTGLLNEFELDRANTIKSIKELLERKE